MNAPPSRAPRNRVVPFDRRAAAFLFVVAFVLSALWAFSTPIPVGDRDSGWGNFHPDEGSHIAVVEYTASHHALPPYQTPYDTSVHPPLYHSGIAALLDGVARPAVGRENALRLVRLLSALMGAGVVYFTFRAGNALAGRRIGIWAALFVLLIPMRAALAGGITNENLAALGAAGALAALCEGVRGGFSGRRMASLVLWTTIGIGSKVTCLGLLPAELLILLWDGQRRGTRLSTSLARFGAVLLAVGVSLGWWFARNIVLYGDPFRKAAADRLWDPVQPGFALIGPQKHMAAWRYALSLYGNGFMSFWGAFDGMTHQMPWIVYFLLLGIEAAAGVGLIRFGLLLHRRWVVAHWPLLAAWGILVGATVFIYTQYNWRHYTPQGRYFFVLLVPFGVLTALGWRAAFPRRSIRRAADTALLTALVGLNLWALSVMPRRIGKPTLPVAGRTHDTISGVMTGSSNNIGGLNLYTVRKK